MKVKEITYDKAFPYIIEDGWGGHLCCTKDDLKELKKEIEKLLKKDLTNGSRCDIITIQ